MSEHQHDDPELEPLCIHGVSAYERCFECWPPEPEIDWVKLDEEDPSCDT